MSQQRGFADVAVLLAVAVAVALGLAGAYFLGRAAGVAETRADQLEQTVKDQAAYAAMHAKLAARVRDKEAAHAAAVAAVDKAYEKGRKDGDAQAKRDRAAVDDGTLVLRDPGGRAPGGSGIRAPGAGAGSGDAAPGAQFSTEASRFLLDLVNEADAVVRQLLACQAVVEADRK